MVVEFGHDRAQYAARNGLPRIGLHEGLYGLLNVLPAAVAQEIDEFTRAHLDPPGGRRAGLARLRLGRGDDLVDVFVCPQQSFLDLTVEGPQCRALAGREGEGTALC